MLITEYQLRFRYNYIYLFRPASYFTSELYSSSATKDIITPPFNFAWKYQKNTVKYWSHCCYSNHGKNIFASTLHHRRKTEYLSVEVANMDVK